MKNFFKTTFILLAFLGAVIGIAYIVASLLNPEKKLRYNQCILLKAPQTGQVECFGCYNNICKDAPADWHIYKEPETGTKYDCQESAEQGCVLKTK